MQEADGFRLEAAEQFGFVATDPGAGAFDGTYVCTVTALIAFAKACERKGRAEAIKIADDLHGEGDGYPFDNGAGACGWNDATRKIVEVLTALNAVADAELTPIREAEEARYMTAQGYVRGPDEPGKRWIKP